MTPLCRDLAVPVHLQPHHESQREIPATLAAVELGAFLVRSPIQLNSGARLSIIHPHARMEASVIHCRRIEGGAYQLGLVLTRDLDRRSEPRTRANCPATLSIPGSAGRAGVTVVDISPSGLGLELPNPLLIGTPVTIQWDAAVATGEICHCQPSRARYRAGMRVHELAFRDPSWSRSVEQRQASYQAILFSLAAPVTAL